MEFLIFGHRFGDHVVPPEIKQEVESAITQSSCALGKKSSKSVKAELLGHLYDAGWPSKVELDPVSKIAITSMKSKIGLAFQTGNMGRMYADLIKLQTLYLREIIRGGIIILPSGDAAKSLGDNIANFDRLSKELPIFERVISAPILVYGFNRGS